MGKSNISVIIPTYNRANMVGDAIESVLRQTMAPAELIIIDDGSDDETEKIVHSYVEKTNIPILYNKQENKGPAAARNSGIKRAAAPLIAFLDSDDYWLKNKLEVQFNSMSQKPHFNISHTMERWVRRGKHLNQKKKHQPPSGEIFKKCLQMCCVGMSTVLIKTEMFEKYGLFDPALRCCEDYDYWVRLAREELFLMIGYRLTVKNGGRDDQVSTMFGTGIDRYRIFSIVNLIESGVLDGSQSEAAIDELIRKCSIYGNGCMKHGKLKEGQYILALPEKYRKNSGKNQKQ